MVEERVKQRLVGAIVLVALAVIFIPMILQGPDDGSGSGSSLPPPPKVVQQPLPSVPPPGTVPARPAEGTALGGSPGKDGAATAPPSDAGHQPRSPAPPEASTAPAAAPSAPTGHQQGGNSAGNQALTAWVVQVGSFSQQDNATSLRDKLRTKGFKAFVQQASTSEGAVYRVEVGPILKRADADALRDKLQAQMQLKGLVVPHR
ncbi:MAG TPA: SPOR domain-containing protein [Gammaproteobacteria bacterium]|nr:SPOR domain-containing protein [Gammaproteobacteria bacterium]